ncbi:MAG: hypothetical protein ABR521_08635 [Gaiellaceae bacterium]
MAQASAKTPKLVGAHEAAQLLGISKSVLSNRRQWQGWRPGHELPASLPEPVAQLRCGPIWLRSEIAAYAREAKRRASLDWFERRALDRRRGLC